MPFDRVSPLTPSIIVQLRFLDSYGIGQGRSVTDIWGRDKSELTHNKNFREGGGHEGGLGQKFGIIMVKIKEFFNWEGGLVPKVPPQPTGLQTFTK